MPTTPGCQPLPLTTMTLRWARPSFSIISAAFSKISFSVSRRSVLSSSILFASLSASDSLSVVRSLNAISALPSLPAAFILGAIPKAIREAFISPHLIPATLIIAESPADGALLSFFIPSLTMLRFSPFSGIMSAVTATLKISAYSDSSSSGSAPSATHISRNTTSAPQISLNSDGQSALCGSTTASAGGNTSPGKW